MAKAQLFMRLEMTLFSKKASHIQYRKTFITQPKHILLNKKVLEA